MPSVPFSLRLDAAAKARLEEEARLSDRSASYLAGKAIESFLDARAAKRRAVEAALRAADEGVFVSSEAVSDWMDRWDIDGEAPAPKPDIAPPAARR